MKIQNKRVARVAGSYTPYFHDYCRVVYVASELSTKIQEKYTDVRSEFLLDFNVQRPTFCLLQRMDVTLLGAMGHVTTKHLKLMCGHTLANSGRAPSPYDLQKPKLVCGQSCRSNA